MSKKSVCAYCSREFEGQCNHQDVKKEVPKAEPKKAAATAKKEKADVSD